MRVIGNGSPTAESLLLMFSSYLTVISIIIWKTHHSRGDIFTNFHYSLSRLIRFVISNGRDHMVWIFFYKYVLQTHFIPNQLSFFINKNIKQIYQSLSKNLFAAGWATVVRSYYFFPNSKTKRCRKFVLMLIFYIFSKRKIVLGFLALQFPV